ncbi:hypothetical protein [Streptomyces sp. SID3343]|uniref:hypothetical protein n=1 Tax=Streptomyces sp. SID3343 TaxID=2690260 RepID=UPI001370B582|nr:hypothetical protein [Streptomyces sp. SID3343]MYW01606.1 hypothetical protein [Streptomyces sp. SID3343]
MTRLLAAADLVDVYRHEHRNPERDPAGTWPVVDPARPQDRVDALHILGPLDVEEVHHLVLGWPKPVPDTAANRWPSDHAAVVATFSVPA